MSVSMSCSGVQFKLPNVKVLEISRKSVKEFPLPLHSTTSRSVFTQSPNHISRFLLPQVSPQTRRRARASLSDISSPREIEGMSVRQLKEILARNFVNYSGCCEKWELVERVSRLYRETEENRKSCGCSVTMLCVALCYVETCEEH